MRFGFARKASRPPKRPQATHVCATSRELLAMDLDVLSVAVDEFNNPRIGNGEIGLESFWAILVCCFFEETRGESEHDLQPGNVRC